MRLTALAALSCLALIAGGVEAHAASLSVPLDRSVRLSVPGSAASVVIGNPDIAEDRRRLDNFKRTREAIPLRDVKAWVESWGTDKELPRPKPQRLR